MHSENLENKQIILCIFILCMIGSAITVTVKLQIFIGD